ncbi:MAG: sigma-70 family RNA polymerase sigma factor [Gammaproteobacteria bacterium]
MQRGGEVSLDGAGLEQAFVDHREDLVRFLGRRLRCLFTARDIAQDVYFRTRRVERDTKVENPRALLFEIAANLAVDHQRVEARRSELLQEAHDLLWSEEQEVSPERRLLAQDELERIHAALERIPERSRRIFYLNRYEGLTQKEIAAALGISRTNVEKHMRRALRCISEAKSALDDEVARADGSRVGAEEG